MPGSISDYTEKKFQDLVFGNTSFSAPATIYFGLWTSAVDDLSTGVTAGECTGGGYARLAVTNNTTNFPNASGVNALKQNGTAFTFSPNPSATWGTASYGALLDSSSGAGNILAWFPLTNAKVINSGDTVSYPINSIQFTMSGNLSDYLEKKLMDHLFGNTAYSPPAITSIGLWTANLDGTSTGATSGECSGGSYARYQATNNPTNWPNASGVTALKQNGVLFTYSPSPTAGWGQTTYYAILDSATLGAGNILAWFAQTTPKTINIGDTVTFPVNSIQLTSD